jgi:hypothetical protein
MSDKVLEAQYVDLSDDELKALVGCLFEGIKRLAEAKKIDQELEAMSAALKDLENSRYNFEIKVNGRRLKAARSLAKVRGITFKLEQCDE